MRGCIYVCIFIYIEYLYIQHICKHIMLREARHKSSHSVIPFVFSAKVIKIILCSQKSEWQDGLLENSIKETSRVLTISLACSICKHFWARYTKHELFRYIYQILVKYVYKVIIYSVCIFIYIHTQSNISMSLYFHLYLSTCQI